MTSALESLWREARNLGGPKRSRKAPPPLLFFTDPARTPRPDLVLARLPRGSGLVFRAFGAADAAEEGRRLVRLARRRGVRVLVGADVALALAIRADGVHLPERLSGRRGTLRRLRRRFILTAAVHGLPALLRAQRLGVDAVVLSPVFPSTSPSAGQPLGPRRFAAMARRSALPVYALGGVKAANAKQLRLTGAAGIAAVSALTESPEPIRT
jgi:thiamine-phosphate pyrophosphorylase